MVRIAALVVTASLLVVGCSSDDPSSSPPDDQPTTSVSPGTTDEANGTTTSTATTSTTVAGEPEDVVGDTSTDEVTSAGFPETGPPSFLSEVRVGEHDGFQRIVFEFSQGVPPSYQIRYVDDPPTAPSGQPADVEGDAYLEITMIPASGVDLSSGDPRQLYGGPTEMPGPTPDGVVVELVQAEDFESRLNWVVGLTEQVPFAVVTAEDPSRLVVDLVP